jgi:FkbM family methyltransferase
MLENLKRRFRLAIRREVRKALEQATPELERSWLRIAKADAEDKAADRQVLLDAILANRAPVTSTPGPTPRAIDPNLQEVRRLVEGLAVRSHPYYPLREGWGLTALDSGHYFFVNTNDLTITPWLIMSGQWEPEVSSVMSRYVQPGMRVADIGANMGYYTVKLGALLRGRGGLVAFEPNPEVAPFCTENIKINGLGGIARFFDCALGEEPGEATLTVPGSNMASANLTGEQVEGSHSHKVKVARLDDVVSGAFDFIKLDAEGYEPMILRGGRETLRRSPDCGVMMEVNLRRWERQGPFSEMAELLPGRAALVVKPGGKLAETTIQELASYLETQPFTECYVLFCPERHKPRFAELNVPL